MALNGKQESVFLVGILVTFSLIPEGSSILNTGKRQLKTEFLCPPEYQQCMSSPSNSSFLNLYHTTAVGANNTLHYVSSTLGSPSVLVALTTNTAKLSVDYDKLMSGNETQVADSISFNDTVHYTFCLVLSRLWQYSDISDVADLDKVSADNTTEWAVYPLDSLPWTDSSLLSNVSSNQLVFQVDQDSTLQLQENGSLTFNFQPFGVEDRSVDMPHLEHTPTSAQLDLVLDNLLVSFNQSRYAVEMLLVSSDPSTDMMGVMSHRSIDDEHTPGVFQLTNWFTSSSTQKVGAYLQWKPVCYKSSSRDRADATKVKLYDLQPGDLVYNQSEHRDSVSRLNLGLAYYGQKLYTGDHAMRAANISFGLSKDKFYTHTNYTTWTLTVGYGTPPQDEVSALIILVISIGLGVPVVLMVFGGLCVCIKKQKRKKYRLRNGQTEPSSTGYTRIN